MYEQFAGGGLPLGPDPTLGLFTAYTAFIGAAILLGIIAIAIMTLPIFFGVIYLISLILRVLSNTGWLMFKVAQLLIRTLLRSPLRTSLSYIAIFVLTTVITGIYSIVNFIGLATAEKESNFKVILTEKYTIPSQMPPGYEQRLKDVLRKLPPELQPVNGEQDVIAWSFVGGTTDPTNPRQENAIFMFCVDPLRITTMMDGLEKKDLTDAEYNEMQKLTTMMKEDYKRIIMSKARLEKMNLKVGQKIKVTSLFYKDIVFEFEIIGMLPDGKYEGVGFCSREYLDKMVDAWSRSHNGEAHPLADKCVNLVWARLPKKESYEQLAAMVNDPKYFSAPSVKLETASAGIGSFLDAYRDIFFGMKYIMCPAMIIIMSLVIANAISISVRERRGEMAVLKVLGFRPFHVMFLILAEAVLIGFFAGFMSTFLCWWRIQNVKFQIAFLGAFYIPTAVILYGTLLGMVVAFVGSILPAWSARSVKVSEVFSKIA
jgi:putative ABC transport system permease protein